jgi:hypothetical protein
LTIIQLVHRSLMRELDAAATGRYRVAVSQQRVYQKIHNLGSVLLRASSTSARSNAANPRATGKYAHLLCKHGIDEINDDSVKAFVLTGDHGDSKTATRIAQWCLDHGGPRLCDKVLASRGPDDQPLVTKLHLSHAAMDCVSAMPDCAHLASVQFDVKLEPAANVGNGLIAKLLATTQLNPAVRKLRFVSGGDAGADAVSGGERRRTHHSRIVGFANA